MNDTKKTSVKKEKVTVKPAAVSVQPSAAAVMHKIFTGKVVSTKRTKTIGVSVDRVVTHAKYGKQLKRSTILAVHNETLELKVGDSVRIQSCRPISKTKHFTVLEKV